MQRKQCAFAFVVLWMLVFGCVASSFAQGNTATLSGSVTDAGGGALKGARVTVKNKATGTQRTVLADDSGRYSFVELPPGDYVLAAEGPAEFAKTEDPLIVLTVGEQRVSNLKLPLRGQTETTIIHSDSAPIEPWKTDVSQTVEQLRIDALPTITRKPTDFVLTDSTAKRDVSPTIGPAPNSGYSVGGARARSNTILVDGLSAVDNSVNGIRPTISQEGVQEFQLITSNYNAEFGQATGGVINIVTKSGANSTHGDLFGFFRNKSFQARNAFSGEVDPLTGKLNSTKQAFTRVQAGATLGGALRKDKTFYFFSYEYTNREETDFSSIGSGNFGLSPFNCGGCRLDGLPLTSAQSAAVLQLLQAGQTNLASKYAALLGSASSVAVNRIDPGLICGSVGLCPPTGVPGPGVPGARFPVPIDCPANATVNNVQCTPFGVGLAPLPVSYVGLNSLRGNFPSSEKTSLWSLRLDHHWSDRNNSFLRVGVSPSLVTGIESTSQNQVFGQNAGTRAGVNQSRDFNFTFQHLTIVDPTLVNTFRFQYARRGVHFGFSQLPGGDQIGVNIPGYAYFGREPYSTVDRIERRTQFTDNVSLVRGHHTFKFGGDVNVIQLRSAKSQIFQLDFGGDVNFGGLSASTFGFPDCVGGTGSNCSGGIALPGATGLQAYGLGIPTTYIQGIGSSNQPFDNLPFGFFAQDSWKLSDKLTLNYGVRYDVEITPLFPSATAINQQAEKALGVVEGIPRDYNNVAPRIGVAWDPHGDGKTSIRLGYGLFYDHPLLAIAFNSVTAEGGRSVQLLSAGGRASACGLIPGSGVCGGSMDTPTNLNGSSIFQGVLNALPNMFYLPDQQRFDPLAAGSLFANQNYLTAGFPLPILPFTLPVDKKFVFGYSQQANLTVERQLAGSWTVSVGYQWTRGLHLNRPVDINSTDPVLLTNNLLNADAAGLGFSNPLTVSVPGSSVAAGPGNCGLAVIAPSVLGVLNGCPAPLASLNGKFVGTPAFFNFFRRSGPNPSFAALTGGYINEVGLAQIAGYPVGFGIPVPFNSVDTQQSTGTSWYNALTVNLNRKFSKGFDLLSSYTWSHAIDDSTDLQSTLEPADSRFPNLERANSVNDQRHRWVTSAVFISPRANRGDGLFKWLTGQVTVAPLIEVSSGRPFNVITGSDARLDLGASQARPSLGGATSSPFIPGVTFTTATSCLTNAGAPYTVPGITPFAGCNGNLGRNRFTTTGFFQMDLRLAKRIPLGETFRLDLIADGFNLLNRTNIAAVNQLCDPTAGATCFAGQPTAAYDARQFQFAVKLAW
ncbi:MAG: hypothetical protein NVS9B4_03840 [Candidatus Acidiferrum sp.]